MNAPLKPPEKFAEAKRFLPALNPTGPWALTAIRPSNVIGARRTATPFCTAIEQAMEFVAEHTGKLNIHLTANTTKPVSDKPRERELERLIVVQVDIDEDEEGKRLASASKQKVIKRLQSSEFCEAASIPGPPTFIIDSGNGVQALWRIADGGLAPTEENIHSVKEKNAHIIAALHGDKGTHNPVQLMRLPGTTNIPSATKLKAGLVKCEAKLVAANQRAYSASMFRHEPVLHLSAEGASPIGPGEPIESTDALIQWRVPDFIVRIVEQGRDPEWEGKVTDDSDSWWQFIGIRGLLDHGVPDAIVKGIITDEKWGIARSTLKEGRNRTADDYADRQIQRANAGIVAARITEFPDDIDPALFGGIAEQQDEPSPTIDKIAAVPRLKINIPVFRLTGETSGIPPRDIMLPGGYIRGFVCGTVGHGGEGKSQHTMTEAVALVTGLPLLGIAPKRRYRWALWNGEDPMDEIRRRFGAICKHYEVSDVAEGFYAVSGRDMPICLAMNNSKERAVQTTRHVGELIEFLLSNKIDGLTIDPFLACHRIEENSNDGMEIVMQALNRIATEAAIAIHIVHHPSKSSGADGMVMSPRGGGAILAKLRASRSLYTMTVKEAAECGILKERRYYFYRVTASDKRNLGIPAQDSNWYEFKDVRLGNAMEVDGVWTKEDCMGVPASWEYTIRKAEKLRADVVDEIKMKLGDKEWCVGPSNPARWVGTPVAKGIKMEWALDDKGSRKYIHEAIAQLVEDKHIVLIKRRVNGKGREFYVATPRGI